MLGQHATVLAVAALEGRKTTKTEASVHGNDALLSANVSLHCLFV